MQPGENDLISSKREDEILSLVSQIQSGDRSKVAFLWQLLEDLCAWYCRKVWHQLPKSYKLEYEDLFNCGYIALCEAISHFDTAGESKFSFYYLFYLTAAIYRENSLPRGRKVGGKKKTDPLIVRETKSLDEPVSSSLNDAQDDPKSLHDFLIAPDRKDIPDSISGRIEDIYLEQLREALEYLISQLPENEQHLIRRKYYDRADLHAVAREMSETFYRTEKMENHALIKLRRMGEKTGLEQFLESRMDYYSGNGYRRFKESGERAVEVAVERRMILEREYKKLTADYGEIGNLQ